MKITLCIFAILATAVYAANDLDRAAFACVDEIQKADVEYLDKLHRSGCFFACIYEKLGAMIDGKILPEKYFDVYMVSMYTGQFDRTILLECINDANEQPDKCNVGRIMSKCIEDNEKMIFPNGTDDDSYF